MVLVETLSDYLLPSGSSLKPLIGSPGGCLPLQAHLGSFISSLLCFSFTFFSCLFLRDITSFLPLGFCTYLSFCHIHSLWTEASLTSKDSSSGISSVVSKWSNVSYLLYSFSRFCLAWLKKVSYFSFPVGVGRKRKLGWLEIYELCPNTDS